MCYFFSKLNFFHKVEGQYPCKKICFDPTIKSQGLFLILLMFLSLCCLPAGVCLSAAFCAVQADNTRKSRLWSDSLVVCILKKERKKERKKTAISNESSSEPWNLFNHQEGCHAFLSREQVLQGEAPHHRNRVGLGCNLESPNHAGQCEGSVCLFARAYFLNYLFMSVRGTEMEKAALT